MGLLMSNRYSICIYARNLKSRDKVFDVRSASHGVRKRLLDELKVQYVTISHLLYSDSKLIVHHQSDR